MRSRKHIYRKLLCYSYLALVMLLPLKATKVYADYSKDIGSNGQPVQQVLLPLPDNSALDKSIVNLGHQLFHDPILSGSKKLACSSCHDLNHGGDDNRQFSLTDAGNPRTVNTPTIFNTTHNFTFLWSGRFESLETLLSAIISSPTTMNADWSEVLIRLENTKVYVEAFNNNFEDGITQENVIKTLVTFQQSLVTSNSTFDQYLRGNESALTDREKQGYGLFYSYGCASCHQGKNIGGNMFQKFGLFNDYYKDTGKLISEDDLGRFNVTGNERDKFFYRVPSLRNVTLTAPYLHDGSISALDEVIRIMGVYQLGRELPETDRGHIEAFLETLTSRYDDPFSGRE